MDGGRFEKTTHGFKIEDDPKKGYKTKLQFNIMTHLDNVIKNNRTSCPILMSHTRCRNSALNLHVVERASGIKSYALEKSSLIQAEIPLNVLLRSPLESRVNTLE